MNYNDLKTEIEQKLKIEDYGFIWHTEEESKEESGEDDIVLAATFGLGHNLSLFLLYRISAQKFEIEFMKGFAMEAEISDEFFEYVNLTYVAPISQSTYNLPYMSQEFRDKIDQRAKYLNTISHSESNKELMYFYSKGDYDDFMVKQENAMIFNSFLAHPPVDLASADYWTDSNRSRFLTSFSASSFSIIRLKGKGRGRNRSSFFFKLIYFPDKRSAPIIRRFKQTSLKDTPFLILPEDMPIDLFGAIISCEVQDLIPFDEWKKQVG